MRSALLLTILAVTVPASCTQLVRYTDELVEPATGRTFMVRTPAALGGVVGFIAGVPVDILALPITWVVYRSQEDEARDAATTFLFPSVVLERVGRLIAVPFDAVEYVVYRMWLPEETRTRDQRERLERVIDEKALPSYPVEVLYGEPPAQRR